jgi:arylsulfatase A-like enzyme
MSKSQTRREFLAVSGAFLAGACAGPNRLTSSRVKSAPVPPNVIYIMTDQQRYDTLRCNGNPNVLTPSLDRLAEEGVRFESCYAAQPVCSPCRSSMVTGLFPHATGVIDNNIPLDPNLFSYPRAMGEAGYQVCYIGKWHLGTDPVPEYFNVWHGYNTGWPHWMDKEKTQYRPDEETDFAISFIRENKDRPFLCWLSFYPPHTPKTAPQENVDLYKGKIEPRDQAIYHAMVNRLDWNVGRLLQAVDELGIREKTLIVFTSDHGENFPERWNNHHKRLCYDQAANVPLIMSWPGTLSQQRVIADVFSMTDLPVTILDLCDLPWPDNLHGQSAKQLLQGDPTGWHDAILIENRPYRWDHSEKSGMWERCIVTNEWKLILNTDRPPELYRRASDPAERENLYGKPDVAEITPILYQKLGELGKATQDDLTPKLIKKWQNA